MKAKLHSVRRLSSMLVGRRGSMLIMVIVILVLLALIGTAMISSSRVDRLAGYQHSINTQIELLLESVKNMAKGEIQKDVYSASLPKTFRSGGGYTHLDAVGTDASGADKFLASRIPGYDAVNNRVFWPFVTTWATGTSFESPNAPAPTYGGAASGAAPTYQTAILGRPREGLVLGNFGQFPAFINTVNGDAYIAGDADGDGQPDSGLVRFPIGQINGITYYYAIRIIDNGSAINASTAMSVANDYATDAAATPIANDGFFPANIGLLELINVPGDMANYHLWRNKNQSAAVPYGPFRDDTTIATDFAYISQGDAMNSQLARRLSNPGLRNYTAPDAFSYQAPLTDAMSLAYRFICGNPNATSATLESQTTGIPSAVTYNPYTTPPPLFRYHPDVHASNYYRPGRLFGANSAAVQYFYDNFDFSNTYNGKAAGLNRPLRSILVTSNPVSNLSPAASMDVLKTTYAPFSPTLSAVEARTKMPNYSVDGTGAAVANPVAKTSINTAPFNKLWRAYWNVMVKDPATNSIPDQPPAIAVAPTADGWGMFRNVLRDPQASPTQKLTSQEMMMLRSAIAAVNTIDLRDNDFCVTGRRVVLYDTTSGAEKYHAWVYGTEAQPYITEVYANNDTSGPNPKGYVAVELHNPYPYAISLAFWNLGIVNRQAPPAPGVYPALQLKQLTSFTGFSSLPTVPVIPPYSSITLENFDATGLVSNADKATVRPLEVGTPVNSYFVPGLQEVMKDPAVPTTTGGELVLLRPRRMLPKASPAPQPGATTGAGTTPEPPTLVCDALSSSILDPYEFDEVNLHDLIPADQFDFTKLNLPTALPLANGEMFRAIHYRRANGTGNAWKFVYPGTYTVNAADPPPTNPGDPSQLNMRHEAVETVMWGNAAITTNPWATGALFTFGATVAAPPAAPNIPGEASTYPNTFPAIQLSNCDFAGWNRPVSPPATAIVNRFPFGGFARNGDMLQVPFIGAYKIRPVAAVEPPAEQFLELNSVTMDCAFVEDQVPGNNTYESLGRFCPTKAAEPNPAAVAEDGYAWAADLFDHLTVSAPSDDYFPNVDPNLSDSDANAYGITPAMPSVYRYPQANAGHPTAVKNGSATAADSRLAATPTAIPPEELVPLEGLVNINTAPWVVLAQLPWCPPAQDLLTFNPANGQMTLTANTVPDRVDIARMIAAWRDGNSGFATPNGPFKSLFDLNKIAATNNTAALPVTFQNCFGVLAAATDPDDAFGDFSPYNPTLVQESAAVTAAAPAPAMPPVGAQLTVDGVRSDFEERFLMVNRISNLVTTRSDSFTVYVLVQGWENVGTTKPVLVASRRAAFIVDRSTMTPVSNTMNITNVPTE